jgi:ankyrin repeat protein
MALHLAACISVSVDVMEFLLEQNIAALNEQDSMGNLPVHCAVKYYAPFSFITFLMSHHRTCTTAINLSGQTPLYIACSMQQS